MLCGVFKVCLVSRGSGGALKSYRGVHYKYTPPELLAREATCPQLPAKAHLCPVHGPAGQSRKTNSFCFSFYALCKSAWLAVWLHQLLSLQSTVRVYGWMNPCIWRQTLSRCNRYRLGLSKSSVVVDDVLLNVSDYGHLKE